MMKCQIFRSTIVNVDKAPKAPVCWTPADLIHIGLRQRCGSEAT